MDQLAKISQLAGYVQIKAENIWGDEMSKIFEPVEKTNSNFKVLKIFDKEDVWPEFSKLFGGNL